jgi:D-alanyl-lipoteichoic acid acyltransferase DltB (MBOAT superfamily)
MRFNSIEFLLFFAIVFFILWGFIKFKNLNKVILLCASYIFYGWWDYRFLFLMFISSVVDYTVGYYIPKSNNKKLLVGISIFINLGLLMFFKYFNFFIESASDLVEMIGFKANYSTLSIILPVGISFYTFQTLSYSLDVYKGKIKPEHDFINFLNYVSFFPQLVAGPIERAATFLPQFRKERVFSYENAVEGMRLLLYGFFKKMVIADNVSLRVDLIFSNYQSLSSLELLFGGMLFFIQLYTDFSGYTDIARGCAKLLGFDLMRNFRIPQFSTSIPEMWSKWHISLTTWFRDYLFLWLAGMNRKSTLWRIISTIILFLVIGFWHGANYTFIVFGLVNGLFFIPRILSRDYKGLRDFLKFINTHVVINKFVMFLNFIVCSLIVIFFRSPNITHSYHYFGQIFSLESFHVQQFTLDILPLCFGFFAFEWIMKEKSHPFDVSGFNPILRKSLYIGMTIAILLFGYFGEDPFYYFQF